MDGVYRDILGRLNHLRQEGARWCAVCPVHGGNNKRCFRAWLGDDGRLLARCWSCGASFGDIVRATGTKMGDWFPPRPEQERRRSKVVAERVLARYVFRDEKGDVLFEEVRLTPFPGQAKRVRYRRPMPDGAWAWSLQQGVYRHRQDGWQLADKVVELDPTDLLMEAVPLVPYRLPELLASRTAVVVEGPKDADTLVSLGFVATASPCGARNWKASFGAYLAGRDVTVLPDADAAGEDYAVAVLGSALAGGALSVRLCRLATVSGVIAKDVTELVHGPWRHLRRQDKHNLLAEAILRAPVWRVTVQG